MLIVMISLLTLAACSVVKGEPVSKLLLRQLVKIYKIIKSADR